MMEVEPGVFKGHIPRAAWESAVSSFDGRELSSDHPLESVGWRAAGMLDAYGEVSDAWYEALVTTKHVSRQAFIVARRGQLAYTTQLADDGRHVVVTTGRASLLGDDVALHEPIYEVFCAPVQRSWQLVRRALPPEFTDVEGEAAGAFELPVQMGPERDELVADGRAASSQFVAELEKDPIVRLAAAAKISVSVALWRGDQVRSWLWFTADDRFFRCEEDDVLEVSAGDLGRVLESQLGT